mgnify:FL=1|tara:strand:- start:2241 stop:2699 length:459 start_codon:yes stop_codon:yes gene_type:complete
MKLKILIIAFFLTGCGFKVVDQKFFEEYRFSELNITGDNRVVYLFKNKLKIDNENSYKNIKIKLDTKKIKTVKEKNIQNEITKYEIIISVKTVYIVENSGEMGEFFLSKKGDYNINSKHSETLNNEKILIKNLINDIADQIIRNLKIRLDDL